MNGGGNLNTSGMYAIQTDMEVPTQKKKQLKDQYTQKEV